MSEVSTHSGGLYVSWGKLGTATLALLAGLLGGLWAISARVIDPVYDRVASIDENLSSVAQIDRDQDARSHAIETELRGLLGDLDKQLALNTQSMDNLNGTVAFLNDAVKGIDDKLVAADRRQQRFEAATILLALEGPRARDRTELAERLRTLFEGGDPLSGWSELLDNTQ